MPSRRQIREAVVQFLYGADLEGATDPVARRDAFWDFVTESELRNLLLATFASLNLDLQSRSISPSVQACPRYPS
jgi:hypothetical protein